MHPKFKLLYLQLEAQRHLYLNWFKESPEELQQVPPAPGKWSAAQILFHLAVIDQMVVEALEKSLQKSKKLHGARIGTHLRSLLLNTFLKLPIKFKAPPVLGDMPASIDVAETMRGWQYSRDRLIQLLEEFPPELRMKEIFRHPRSGMLTIGQTLSFIFEHHQHHQGQLKRALNLR